MSGWIKTSKRLPDDAEVVMTWRAGRVREMSTMHNTAGRWYWHQAEACRAFRDAEPTHWRPLPRPPGDDGRAVEVRIAVVVNADGQWAAHHCSEWDDEEAGVEFHGWLPAAVAQGPNDVCYVTARVPLPRATTVEGEVE